MPNRRSSLEESAFNKKSFHPLKFVSKEFRSTLARICAGACAVLSMIVLSWEPLDSTGGCVGTTNVAGTRTRSGENPTILWWP
jgi:hypothetical protein